MTPTVLVNRVLAALVALALLLGGLLAAVEIVLAHLGRPSWLIPWRRWNSWLSARTWDETLVRLILVGVVLVGLLLLLAALRRGRPRLLPVASDIPGVQMSVLRRGAERAVVTAARRTSGVRNASATIGRRTVKVNARTDLRSSRDLQGDTLAAVNARLRDLGLDALSPRVKVKGKKR